MRRPWLIISIGIAAVLVSFTTAQTGNDRSADVRAVTTGHAVTPPATQAVADTSVELSEVEPVATDPLLPDVSTTTEAMSGYDIQWQSINAGGAPAAGGNYRVNASVGQSAIGTMSGGSYQAGVGYWYGAEAVAVDCACDCHADPQCDGSMNVLDVVQAVNIAFRGTTPVPDPNPMCPYMPTDADCSGFTNVIDVVKFVNVAFRGGVPAEQFCDPCTP